MFISLPGFWSPWKHPNLWVPVACSQTLLPLHRNPTAWPCQQWQGMGCFYKQNVLGAYRKSVTLLPFFFLPFCRETDEAFVEFGMSYFQTNFGAPTIVNSRNLRFTHWNQCNIRQPVLSLSSSNQSEEPKFQRSTLDDLWSLILVVITLVLKKKSWESDIPRLLFIHNIGAWGCHRACRAGSTSAAWTSTYDRSDSEPQLALSTSGNGLKCGNPHGQPQRQTRLGHDCPR